MSLRGSFVERYIRRLYRELHDRGLRFRPHFWVGEEWFTPDGVCGIAVPFYLVHPRLARLELAQMLEVEGGSPEECMRILRHETGHAIENAYRLRRRRRRIELFGKSSEPYPEFYTPRPYSRSFVLHLDQWYAQSHPDEDFAETFAVWLDPESDWRRRYAGWPALRKLEYVDELMRSLVGVPPPVRSRRRVDPIDRLRKTLREHYAEKRGRYGIDYPRFYDRDLRRLFSAVSTSPGSVPAARFVGRVRREARRLVARWTGIYQYTIDRVISDMIERCRELDLYADPPFDRLERDFVVLLAVQTMNYLHSGRHRVAL